MGELRALRSTGGARRVEDNPDIFLVYRHVVGAAPGMADHTLFIIRWGAGCEGYQRHLATGVCYGFSRLLKLRLMQNNRRFSIGDDKFKFGCGETPVHRD